MKIEIICSDDRHPVRPYLNGWARAHEAHHAVTIVNRADQLTGGDILFAISCSEILRPHHRDLFRHALVVHAGDLPKRRGWSPHIWAILEGEPSITVSLLTANDPVDSGLVFHKTRFDVEQTDLLQDINAKLFAAELSLMNWTLENVDRVAPRSQTGEPTYCRRRTPDDSRLDPQASIASQFDILRLADADRFPAFFELHGQRYTLKIEKAGPADDADR